MVVAFSLSGLLVLIFVFLFRRTWYVSAPLFVLEAYLLLRKDVRDTLRWNQGARGEERVGLVLESLRSRGFVALHDLEFQRGNVDHVVVGPTGVFALETKAWRGKVWLASGPRLMAGSRDETSCKGQLMNEVYEVKRRLAKEGADPYVVGCLVLTDTRLAKGRIELGPVTVVDIEDLESFITRRQTRLDLHGVARYANAILRDGAPVSVRSMGTIDPDPATHATDPYAPSA
jgi:hypothetical protein